MPPVSRDPQWEYKHVLPQLMSSLFGLHSRRGLEHPRFGRTPGPRDLATALMKPEEGRERQEVDDDAAYR